MYKNMDARDRHIAQLEGRAYIPSGNTDSMPTVYNTAGIDEAMLKAFYSWIKENKMDLARLIGLVNHDRQIKNQSSPTDVNANRY
jgi:hypothetical protein